MPSSQLIDMFILLSIKSFFALVKRVLPQLEVLEFNPTQLKRKLKRTAWSAANYVEAVCLRGALKIKS